MKLLDTDPKLNSDLLDGMIKGCEKSRILFTALDLGLFDLLDESMTVEDISSNIKSDIKLTGKFLNTLVAMEFLNKDDGKYSNTGLASTFLVKSSPFYQAQILRLSGNMSHDWSILGSALKGDVPEENEKKIEDVFDPNFIHAMAQGSMRGSLHRTVNEVSVLPEFNNAKKLLDLGGGHGLYSIAFAQKNPGLNATVFDLPHVTRVTKEYIERYDMNGRVNVTGGDLLENEIGDGYDIIFASDVLYRKPDALSGQ